MKKVISFVLVLALVLGSFSMAFALTDVQGDANEAAINVVNDLGIVTGYTDGTFQADKAVTRAEFAAMITRALNIPESALAGYTTTSFKDTTGYGWAVKYLAFCNDKGIMLGDGAGNVMPGRTINMNEAVTMALRAIGLTDNSALLVGTWPANYVTIAKTAGLYADIDAVTTVDRGTAAQLIYNLIKADGYQVNADGETTDDEPTLLEGLCDSPKTVGLVKHGDFSAINLNKYVGAWAEIYWNDGEIVAIDPISTFITGEFKDGKFETEDVTYNIDNFTSATAIINADEVEVGTYSRSDAIASGGSVTLAAEVTGKTITKVYSVASWATEFIAQVDEYDLEDIVDDTPALLGQTFTLDKSDEIDADQFELLGVASLDKIAEDNIVAVYAGGANGDIVKIEVGTEVVTGKVTKSYEDADGVDMFVINGTAYYDASSAVAVGEEGTAYLNYDGEIAVWDETKAASENYAVVTDAYGVYAGRDKTIVLFDKNGNEAEYVVVSDADADATATSIKDIVTFELDKNGKVESITKVAIDTFTNKAVVGDKVIGTTKAAADITIFVEDTDGSYYLGKMAELADNISGTAVYNTDGEVAVLYITVSETGSSDDSYGLVLDNTARTLDEDDKTVVLLDVIIDGAVKEDVTADSAFGLTTSVGALQKITVDENGNITGVTTATVASESAIATVSAVDGNVITTADNTSYVVADGALVYVWDKDDAAWTVAKLTKAALKGCTIKLYDTDTDATGYEVIMAVEQ